MQRRAVRCGSNGRSPRLRAAALVSAMAVCLSGCAAQGVLDALAGVSPGSPQTRARGGDDARPAAAGLPLGGWSGGAADTSAGWSPLDPDNADARAARSQFAVPTPRQPALPADPVAPRPPVARLEPPIRPMPMGRGPLVKEIELEPMRDCPRFRDNVSAAMSVVGAPGAIRVTFASRGTPGLRSIQLGAEAVSLRSGTPEPTVWTRLEPPDGCTEVNALIPGLTSGNSYRVLLVEEVYSTVTKRTTARIVARSEPVAAAG